MSAKRNATATASPDQAPRRLTPAERRRLAKAERDAKKFGTPARLYGSDFAKLDAHEITPEEYDEIPEWTDEDFDRAEIRHGDKLIRRGRPPLPETKRQVTLRLDPEVVEGFRATGPGWQSRINDLLRDHLGLAKRA